MTNIMRKDKIEESNRHLREAWKLYARVSPQGEALDRDGWSGANACQPWFFMNVGVFAVRLSSRVTFSDEREKHDLLCGSLKSVGSDGKRKLVWGECNFRPRQLALPTSST